MSMLQQYIEKRMARDPEFAEGFAVGYANFKMRTAPQAKKDKIIANLNAARRSMLETAAAIEERQDEIKGSWHKHFKH